MEQQAGLDLRGFWARRRRLLPALAVLLVVGTRATAVIRGRPSWTPTAVSALAAVTDSSNWWQALETPV